MNYQTEFYKKPIYVAPKRPEAKIEGNGTIRSFIAMVLWVAMMFVIFLGLTAIIHG